MPTLPIKTQNKRMGTLYAEGKEVYEGKEISNARGSDSYYSSRGPGILGMQGDLDRSNELARGPTSGSMNSYRGSKNYFNDKASTRLKTSNIPIDKDRSFSFTPKNTNIGGNEYFSSRAKGTFSTDRDR